MSKKVFNLITALVTGAETISIGLVTFFAPACAVPVNAAIPIIGAAIIAVCKLFVKDEQQNAPHFQCGVFIWSDTK